jgi:hypothetical protein
MFLQPQFPAGTHRMPLQAAAALCSLLGHCLQVAHELLNQKLQLLYVCSQHATMLAAAVYRAPHCCCCLLILSCTLPVLSAAALR